MISSTMGSARAFAQLVRLPNVFTALADVALGALASWSMAGASLGWPAADWWTSYAWLLGATACLYSGGMVWNDFFDVDQDRRERPQRPIPSGRVPRAAAGRLGVLLLALGWTCAFLAGRRVDGSQNWLPAVLAGALVVAILLYDGWLKRTWAGPVGMGLCRFLNVLMGFALGNIVDGFYLAAVVGIYVVGVTWFARTEARQSSQSMLSAAATVMLFALFLALPIPAWLPMGASSPLFPYLLVMLGFLVGVPVCRALTQPAPGTVQAAVKRAIMGLIVLDAVLATALAGNLGLLILLLLPPALYLGRWIYST